MVIILYNREGILEYFITNINVDASIYTACTVSSRLLVGILFVSVWVLQTSSSWVKVAVNICSKSKSKGCQKHDAVFSKQFWLK